MRHDISNVDPRWAWSPYHGDSTQSPNGTTVSWNRRAAAHLFRRAGFSATSEELDTAASTSPSDVVREMVTTADAAAESEASRTDEIAAAMLATGNARNLSAWWLHRMLNTPHPLLEKMTLFWHGHFATSAEKVEDAQLMFNQNQLLRRHALGDFQQLTQEIARDPAMLIYLDSATNRKAHPNENFARELMELFCLGEGNYSERDIQELARSFTGWEVKRHKFRFNRYQHDSGTKTILGKTGSFGGEEGTAIVLRNSAAPQFIARKLIRWFVMDEPAAPVTLVTPIADTLERTNFRISAAVEQILTSNLFFSDLAIGRKVRSPVELGVGLLRSLEGSANLQKVSEALAKLGHAVFYPPNVKGWDGGRSWINTSTLLGRANLVGGLLRDEKTRFVRGTMESLLKTNGLTKSHDAVRWFEELLLAVSLPDDVVARLTLLFEQSEGTENARLITMTQALCSLPEFQLA